MKSAIILAIFLFVLITLSSSHKMRKPHRPHKFYTTKVKKISDPPRAPFRASPPYKVMYIDQPLGWSNATVIAQAFYDMIDAGFNVINLAFLVDGQPYDMCAAWLQDMDGVRSQLLDYAHSRGCSIMASTGGSTDQFSSQNAVVYATAAANFVVQNNLDGLDFDLEGLSPGFIAPGLGTAQNTINWMVTATSTARKILGPNRLISHAPQAPYIGKIGSSRSWVGTTGGYSAVFTTSGQIDFLNIQYYNQGNNYYDYNSIYVNSGNNFPDSAVADFPSSLQNAFAFGKPLTPQFAGGGYNTSSQINTILTQANSNGLYNGVMFWEFPYNNPNAKSFLTTWLNTVTNGI